MLAPKLRVRPTPVRFPLLGLSATILSITKDRQHASLAFAILVENDSERWLLHRRFSEFHRFRQELLRLTSKCTCRCQYLWLTLSSMVFPKKEANFLPWRPAERIAMDRQDRLSQFLSVLLILLQQIDHLVACEHAQCPVLGLIHAFLHVVPTARKYYDAQLLRDLPPKTPRRVLSPSHNLSIYPIREDDEVINCRFIPATTTWV
ncbi:hypothetical protein SPRG_10738 [Saprolegnia parasitica CBS 223.65]|uniref:PX domain-containing protein n=1 Tax=Saprolegnia parasitica (strain CBS 223.65) TaxID=695850 RepID=A0A067CAH1_SAPPC|nr:hypothetical protein SPRG_10738 [Saprolegnia parasitica CBS 223.65]KDO23546.1 hypothetical protein SPRG_10738 [Saprolegnia parasitica CBS 223.65]|eukprot:XP_012205696.1 hypothetical protein SPRG_10738 [Saprolegnia parasitica CBS 223.65]